MNKLALFARDQDAPAASGAGVADPSYRYWAFLSYSHADTKSADRLHHWLERFRIPDQLVGEPHPLGTIPKRLAPIFRDRQELAASSSLGREIQEALEASRYLIVLCSPAAARSRWVDQEVRAFKRLHGDDRVLAAIVAGEPFSGDENECFPPALCHRVGRDGKLTKQRIEPIAADLREDRDGVRIGSLKLAAGMLEVGLDDLVQRDQHRRQKRMTWIVAASIAGMAFTSGLSVIAVNARDAARDERREAEGLVGFMLGDLKDELEPIGRLDALDKVGVRALGYYERQDKTDLSDDQLAQRSKALTLLGQIATARGDTDGALARYREALRSTAELVQRSPADPQRLFDHAQNVFWMGELARQRGRMDQAEAAYREYKNLADRMVAIEPNNPKWRMEELYAKENIGIVLYFQRRFAESAAEIAEAVPVMERLVAKDPANAPYQGELSLMLAWLGDARRDEGRLDLAIAARQRQIDLLRRGLSTGKTNVQLQQKLVPALQAYGILLADSGQPRKAVTEFRSAIAEAETLIAIEPKNNSWRGAAAGARLELAGTLVSLSRYEEAKAEADTACQQATILRQRDPSDVIWHTNVTNCLFVRSRIAMGEGQLQLALAQANEALRSASAERSADRIRDRYRIAAAFRRLGEIHRRLGNRQEAVQAWTAGLAQLPTNVAERPRELDERVRLLRLLGQVEEAKPLTDKLAQMGYRRTN